MTSRLCVGVVGGAQGIKGAVRVKSYTAEADGLTAYGPVEDEAGRKFRLTVIGAAKGLVTVRFDGVSDRDAAEALKGMKLYVPRSALPPVEDDEFYYADLVGLRAELADGSVLGTVKGVYDFGGGDIIALSSAGGELMFSFTRATVPVVDIAGGRLVVAPPQELEPEAGEVPQREEVAEADEVNEGAQ